MKDKWCLDAGCHQRNHPVVWPLSSRYLVCIARPQTLRVPLVETMVGWCLDELSSLRNQQIIIPCPPWSQPQTPSVSLRVWLLDAERRPLIGHQVTTRSTTDQRQPQLRNITAIIRWQQQHYTTWLSLSIGHGHLHPLGYICQHTCQEAQ